MAEIKKINGNTLCDDTAREKADAAQATADEAKGLAETAGEGATEAKTAADAAQETADAAKTATEGFETMVQELNTTVTGLGEVVEETKTTADTAKTTANKANDRTGNLAYHLKGKAIAAEYDATAGGLKCAAYSPDSTGTGTTYADYQEIKKIAVIWANNRAYTIQSCEAYNNIVATCPDEDGLHILSGGFKSASGTDCEFTETVVPYSEQVQADWDENDPESPAYVKNRIGGYKLSDAERLVEYDETTAEYIDVDVTGTGTAYRYRKASDTLVHKEDWIGGKTVIVMDDGSGEQEITMDIGTGKSGAIAIIEKEYAAGKIWLTGISEISCGIIAPQDTDLSASADGTSVVQGVDTSTVVPKGVWIVDLPYMMNLVSNGTKTGYHKAVYCGSVKKIPEEYLETTTAEEAKTTAEEAKTTAEEAKTTAEEAKTTAEEAKTTAEEAKTTAEEAKTTAEEAKTTAEEIKNVDIKGLELLDSENMKTIYVYSSEYASPKYRNRYVYSTELPDAFCLKFINDKGEIAADSGLPYWCRKVDVKNNSGETVGVQLFGCAMSGEKLITIEGKSLTSTKLIDVTYTKEEYPYFYTAGDGIAIEDGVISADTEVLATKEDIPERTVEEWTFTLDSGETVTKKVVLSND